MDSFVEQINNQTHRWFDELDEVVQCPVCMEKPSGKILLCIEGHHICDGCRAKILNNRCPTCNQDINGGRSFLTESVLSKIEDIKKAMVLHITCSLRIPDDQLTDTGTQYTEDDCRTPSSRVDAAKGLFPCRIGSCIREEPHCRMIEHIKSSHLDRLRVGPSANGETFKHTWTVHHVPSTDYDLAFHVTDMELFFVNIELDVDGHLRGSVQILNSNTVGKMFSYSLQVKGYHHSFKFEDVVKSCKKDPGEDCLFVHFENMKYVLKKDNGFECELTIVRKAEGGKRKNAKKN